MRDIERDTKEKGEQAGQWLSQHIYSENEKNQGTGKKANPATGVSEEENETQEGQNRQNGQSTAASDADWHTAFSEMEFAPSWQANQAALDSLKPATQSIATKLENVSAQLNGLRTMNPMYITNIAEHNQSRQALEEQQATLSEQLKQAQAAEQTMKQAYQEATKTSADLLREQYQNQRQAVAQAKEDGLSQAEITQLEAQMNETYQSYLAAWNEENQAQRQAQEQQQQQNLQGLSESARHGSLAQQAQAALLVARRTPGTSPEEIQRLERTLESEEALAEQARQDEQEARQAAQAQQTAASSQTQQQLDALNEQIWQLESAGMIYDANASGMAYSQDYLDLLSEREQLIAQLNEQKEQELQQVQGTMSWGTLEAWAQPDYVLSETEKAAVNAALEEWDGVIGPDFDAYYEAARALRDMGQSTQEIEILLYQAEIMDALATKVSGVRSAFSGAGNALPLIPQIRGALEAENWRRAGFEGTNPLGVAQRSQSAAAQNPVPYALGYGLSSAAQYAALNGVMQAVPGLGGALDDFATALSATGPAQKLQAVPVLGQLATPGAIRSMASDALLDFGLGTVPQMMEQAGTYARQLTQGVRPGEQVMMPGDILGGALQNTGMGLLSNAASELAPAAIRAVSDAWNDRPVLNAMQQQGLEAIQQGAAPSMAQQQALHNLWETSPGYVPANMGAADDVLGASTMDDILGTGTMNDILGASTMDDILGTRTMDDILGAGAADDILGTGTMDDILGASTMDDILGAGAADDVLGTAMAAPQSAAEAAQRQAFAKWTQGEAMTPQETRLVNELWNTDPAKASEYWAAGQFLNTDIPASSALDGVGLNDTMVAEGATRIVHRDGTVEIIGEGEVTKWIDNRPYLNKRSRPSFRKRVPEQTFVYLQTQSEDGLVRDPLKNIVINWTPGQPRKGVWDMGHIPTQKYSDMHARYVREELTPQEFRDWYNDYRNYRVELPSTNRSHKME